ncbi:unnamed protein product, partial [Ectocarpus sp. 12 AP-2014]
PRSAVVCPIIHCTKKNLHTRDFPAAKCLPFMTRGPPPVHLRAPLSVLASEFSPASLNPTPLSSGCREPCMWSLHQVPLPTKISHPPTPPLPCTKQCTTTP